MSKTTEALLKSQEIQMEYYAKFMDHIYDVINPEPRLNEYDIKKLEKSYCNSSNPLVDQTREIVSTNTSNRDKLTKNMS